MTRSLHRALGAALVVALSLGAGACSDDDGGDGASTSAPGDELDAGADDPSNGEGSPTTAGDSLAAEYAAGFVTALRSDRTLDVPIADLECAGDAMVASIGVDRLVELGLDPDEIADGADFSDGDVAPERAEARAMIDALFDCVDVAAALGGFLVDGLWQDYGIDDPDLTGCFVDELRDTDAMEELMTDGLLGVEADEDSARAPFLPAFVRCIDWAAVLAASFTTEMGVDLAPASIECLGAALDDQAFASAILDEGGDLSMVFEVLGSQFVDVVESCLTDEELALFYE